MVIHTLQLWGTQAHSENPSTFPCVPSPPRLRWRVHFDVDLVDYSQGHTVNGVSRIGWPAVNKKGRRPVGARSPGNPRSASLSNESVRLDPAANRHRNDLMFGLWRGAELNIRIYIAVESLESSPTLAPQESFYAEPPRNCAAMIVVSSEAGTSPEKELRSLKTPSTTSVTVLP